MGLPWSCVYAGGWVILMFIMTIKVLVDSFHYNCIESETVNPSNQQGFPTEKKYIGNMIKK